MFSIKSLSENGFDKIILSDDVSKTFVTILPACGAILHGFEVLHSGNKLNVVDHYNSFEDFKKNQTSKGFKSAKLSPFVCRLKKGEYNFAEQYYTVEKFYLARHALHGLIYDNEFVVLEQRADDKSAFVKMHTKYEGSDPGYPFHYECIVSYELKKGNHLTIETSIINRDEGTIPIADGWHPYFTFGNSIDDLSLEFQSADMVEFDDELIPTGKLIPYEEFNAIKKIDATKYDHCFTLNFGTCQPMLVLRDAEKKLQLEIYPDKSYPYLQLYTPDDRKSIAIENLSAAPDAFNNGMGLITLAPGEEKYFKTKYKITALN